MNDKPEVQRPANCDGMRWWSDEWTQNEKRIIDMPQTALIVCLCLAILGLVVIGHALWGWIFEGGK